MSRRMACSLTVAAVRDRTKTVTRRHADTWKTLKVGDRLILIEKGMGLKAGEQQVVLAEVEVIAVGLVPLVEMTDAECMAEGFPTMLPTEFISFWLGSHHAPAVMTVEEWARYLVRRIEWRYLP